MEELFIMLIKLKGENYMKEFIFDKNEYVSYKDFYEGIAKKMEAIKIDDYYDSSTLEYNANILWEFLCCEFGYLKKDIKITLKNFNVDKLKIDKKYDDYQYFYIIKTFKRFIEYFPINALNFIDE